MDRIWLSYAPGWSSHAPLWRLRADLFKKRPKSLKNASFLRFFRQGAQIGCKSRKTCFYVFCLFTSLYGRFRLCRASQTIDIEKIYRLVSKILNFMPSGSVLDRFCVQCKNFVAWASKFYRNSGSPEASSCLGGNREAKSILKTRKWRKKKITIE